MTFIPLPSIPVPDNNPLILTAIGYSVIVSGASGVELTDARLNSGTWFIFGVVEGDSKKEAGFTISFLVNGKFGGDNIPERTDAGFVLDKAAHSTPLEPYLNTLGRTPQNTTMTFRDGTTIRYVFGAEGGVSAPTNMVIRAQRIFI